MLPSFYLPNVFTYLFFMFMKICVTFNRDVSGMRQCFITRRNSEKRVENDAQYRVFLMNFEVFHLVM